MLFPIENEIRQVKNLNGIWKFRREERMGQGTEETWYARPLTGCIEMPVPASYNDITTDKKLRNHVGWVWYEREFAIPRDWMNSRMVLRFGSVTHHAVVYINGEKAAHLICNPHVADITDFVKSGSNKLKIEVANSMVYSHRDTFSKGIMVPRSGLLGPVKIECFETSKI